MLKIPSPFRFTIVALTVCLSAGAQVPPPPGPAPPLLTPTLPDEPTEPIKPSEPPKPAEAPTPVAPAPTSPEPSPAKKSAPKAEAQASGAVGVSLSSAPQADAQASEATMSADDTETVQDRERAQRKASLREAPNWEASTGLLHLARAGSGAAGTFRFALGSSFFKTKGFLCPPCVAPNGGPGNREDSVSRVGADVMLSATPADFLEAYLAVHSFATSNNRGEPQLLQVLGDSTLGLKGFMPNRPDQVFAAGGATELTLLNGTGSVGISSADVTLRGLVTADLDNRVEKDQRIPLRIYGNLSYTFDNSDSLITSTESARNQRITRVERFGLGINRVDRFQMGLGAEGVWDVVRPFAEWTVDLPVNRQGYTCIRSKTYVGDTCLKDDSSFSAVPSRLTLGTRVYPWLEGLSFLLAADIGTGGTSKFWEEVAPEPPYDVYLGVSYAVDAVPVEPPKPVMPEAKPGKIVRGLVVEEGSPSTIAGADVLYDGRDWSGMVTDSLGRFRTIELDPGTYTFHVTAQGYRPADCTIVVSTSKPAAPAQTPMKKGSMPASTALAGSSMPGIEGTPDLRCELKPLPKVGNLTGFLFDEATGQPVAGANVTISDKLGRELTLQSDAQGAFRFERIPEGKVHIAVTNDGYLANASDWEILAQKEAQAQITLSPQPKQPQVVVTQKELQIKQQINFEHDKAVILPESNAILEEIAGALKAHPEIELVEVQGHTDNTGNPVYNMKLSKDRADAVREALIHLGVDSNRLITNGYGPNRPISPNTTPANRARNRRVQLMIQKRR